MKLIVGIFIGFYVGYVWAHYTVANECKKLGGFFVGKETFKCTKIEVETSNDTTN